MRFILIICLAFTQASLAAGAEPLEAEATDDAGYAAIINSYLKATQGHLDELRGASMEVEIEAKVPKLKENGTLRALRKISKVGQITYRVLSFQGDNTVKSQVISRYLDAEKQSQSDSHIAITPDNYKFKYKGQKQTHLGQQAHVFQLSPRKKRVGLFKGELWLDARTSLPVLEKGTLVKNPSIFFRKVDFERSFAIRDGRSVPSYMISTIDTRLVGKVQLNISYSNFAQDNSLDNAGESMSDTAILHSNLCQ